ncbi:MAG TPA: fibronectin type III domain-containing protein [Tepidisphaeraceae bacterium]|nr:fibronectin type III domain-containing protein [Tepidisphaeraceae bacterium]
MTPAADAFVRGGQYAANPYGLNGTIEVKNYIADLTRVGHVKFDISALPGTVASATLRLHGKLAGTVAPLTVSVHTAAHTNWTDADITFTSQPAQTGATLGTFVVNSATASWHELDLTNCVNAAKAAGQNSISLRLTGPNGNTAVIEFSSREASTVANRPQLVVLASAPQAPLAPGGLTAVATSPTQVNLAWADNASDEAGYRIERSTDGGTTFATLAAAASLAAGTTSFNDAAAAAGTQYWYRVVAIGASGAPNSASSNVANAATPALLSVSIGGPATVAEGATYTLSLSASGFGSDAIDHWAVDWDGAGPLVAESVSGNPSSVTHVFPDGLVPATANSVTARAYLAGDATGTAATPKSVTVTNVAPVATIGGVPTTWSGGQTYNLTASATDPGTADTAAGFTYAWSLTVDGGTPTTGSSSTFSLTTTNAGSYVLTLTATDKDGATSVADTRSFTIGGAPVEPPARPTDLQVTATTSSTVTLTWTDNATNETGFRVDHSTSSAFAAGTVTTMNVDVANASGATLSGLTAATPYYFRVRAINGATQSLDSDPVTATTSPATTTVPAQPTGLTASPISPTQVSVTWTDNATNETGYALEYSADANFAAGTVTTINLGANVTSQAAFGLAPQTQYHFRVRATGGVAGDSGYSSVTSTTTPVQLPRLENPLTISGPQFAGPNEQVTLRASVSEPGSYSYAWGISRDGFSHASGQGAEISFRTEGAGHYMIRVMVMEPGMPNKSLYAGIADVIVGDAPAFNVGIDGPSVGIVGQASVFTAQVGPRAVEPLSYRWSVTRPVREEYSEEVFHPEITLPSTTITDNPSFAFVPPATIKDYEINLMIVDGNGATVDAIRKRFESRAALPPQGWEWHSSAPPEGNYGPPEHISDTVLQPDGKIVAAISHVQGSIVVARYNADLTPDVSFNGDGYFFDSSATGSGSWGGSQAQGTKGVALQEDGSILFAHDYLYGSSQPDTEAAFYVGRLTPDGQLDLSFGTGGYVAVQFDAPDGWSNAGIYNAGGARDIVVRSDGRILVSGWARWRPDSPDWPLVDTDYHHSMAVVQLSPTGALDPAFGSDGAYYFSDHPEEYVPGRLNLAAAIELQPDGKVLVAGHARGQDIPEKLLLLRLNVDGTPDDGSLDDTTPNDQFGPVGSGRVELDYQVRNSDRGEAGGMSGGRNSGVELLLTPQGGILLGALFEQDAEVKIFKFNANGDVDTGFGTGGVISEPTALADPGMALQPDGRILLVTTSPGSTAATDYITAYRYLPNGAADTTFKAVGQPQVTPGQIVVDVTSGAERGRTVLFSTDGVVLAGQVEEYDQLFAPADPFLIRLRLDEATPSSLRATATLAGPVELRWLHVGDAEDGFLIERSLTGLEADFTTIGAVGPDVERYTDERVQPGVTYHYRIVGLLAGERSGVSNVASATTAPTDVGYALIETILVPVDGSAVQSSSVLADGVPYQLRASGDFYLGAANAGSAYVKRADAEHGRYNPMPTDVNPNVDYGIGVNDANRGLVKFPHWGPPAGGEAREYAISFTGAGQPITLDYHDDYYADNVVDVPGRPLRVDVYAPLPATPARLTAAPDRPARSVTLAWEDRALAEQYFRVERATDGGAFETIGTVPANVTTYTDGNLALNTRYAYRVTTVSAIGESTASNEAVTGIVNLAPQIAPVPPLTATVGAAFAYGVVATDPEDDAAGLTYALVDTADAPPGLTIDPLTGAVTGWTPTASQVGQLFEATVRVTDVDGAYADERLYLHAASTPPILGQPTAELASPATVRLSASATDANAQGAADEASLTYAWTAVRGPLGAPAVTFDASGTNAAKAATATVGMAGAYRFQVTVTDADGNTASRDVNVTVAQRFTSAGIAPATVVLEQGASTTVRATALDQFGAAIGGPALEELVFDWTVGGSIGVQVLAAPHPRGAVRLTGGTFGGTFDVEVVVTHAAENVEQVATGRAMVRGAANRAPSVARAATASMATPTLVALDVLGADDGGELNLTYAWSRVSGPAGVTFAATTPTNAAKSTTALVSAAGSYTFRVTMTDRAGATTTSDVTLEVPAIPSGPVYSGLRVSPINATVAAGTSVLLTAEPLDQFHEPLGSGGPSAYAWYVDGVQVPGATGATFTYATPSANGLHTVKVVVGALSAQTSVRANVDEAPVVRITTPGSASEPLLVKADLDVRGIVDDANDDLASYQLTLTPLTGGGPAIVLASGTTAESGVAATLTDARVGRISPTMLADGVYRLRLEGIDATNRTTADERLIRVRTDLKLGNLALPFTDVEIDVPGGMPLTATRAYDTLEVGRDVGLGKGWRLDLSDVALRTTARGGAHGTDAMPALRSGDLVTMTIPGRGTHTFQFLPRPLNYKPGAPGIAYFTYAPQFVAIDGSNAVLTAPEDGSGNPFVLTRDGQEFYSDTTSGRIGYNPARATFGGAYTITEADGTAYAINATAGRLTQSTDPNGNVTTYAADGNSVTSAGNVRLELVRSGSRVTGIDRVDGDGPAVRQVTYGYTGDDLTSVTDRANSVTHFEYGDAGRPHHLTAIRDARDVTVLAVEYDAATGRVSKLVDVRGGAAPISGGGFDGHRASQTVTDMAGNDTETQYDAQGNVTRTIQANRDAAGHVVGYTVTVQRYASVTADVLDPIDTGRSLANAPLSVEQYAPFTVAGPDANGQRYTRQPTTLLRRTEFHLDAEDATSADQGYPSAETSVDANGVARTTRYSGYVKGRPTKIVDPDGNVTWNAYDDAGNLTWSVGALGEGTEFVYSNSPLASDPDQIERPDLPGGLLLRTYTVKDDDGDNATRPATPDRLTVAPDVTNDYYAPSNVAPGEFKGMLWKSTDRNGLTTRYMYTSDGQAKETFREWTDANGFHSVRDSLTEYDAAGRVWKSTSYPNPVLDPDGQTTETHYDALGRAWESVDVYGGRTRTTYDAAGHAVRTLYPDGTETRMAYDAMGRVAWTSERFASSTTYDAVAGTYVNDNAATYVVTRSIYDGLGRVVGTERYRDGKITIEADASVGQGLLRATAPDAAALTAAGKRLSTTSTTYDSQGRAATQTDASGLTTETQYYPNGQVWRTRPVTSPASNWTSYAYGKTDGLIAGAVSYDSVTDALGHTTKTFKDRFGRTLRTVFHDGSFTQSFYGIGGLPADPANDVNLATPAGLIIPIGGRHEVQVEQRKTNDPVVATHRVYDASGRLTDVYLPAVDDADPNSLTHGQSVRPHWQYTYDANGNQLTQVDPKGRVTSCKYDEQNRRTSRTLPDNISESWTYDAHGRTRTHVDFERQTTAYAYDDSASAGGRLDAEHRFAKGVAALDANGGIVVANAAERTWYHYDALGRQDQVKEYAGAALTRTTTYEFDPVTGGTTKIASLEGVLNHAYDPATGRMTRTWTSSNDTTYRHDEFGRLWKVIATKLNGATVNQTTTYAYDAVSNLDLTTFDNGTPSDAGDDPTHDYAYTNLNQLDTLVVKRGTANVFAQDYDYDSNGQRDKVTEHRGSELTVIDWTNDGLGRLTKESYDSSDNGKDYLADYKFDLASNRVSKVQSDFQAETTISLYNDRNQLTSTTANGVTTSYTYDDNGSMLTKGSDGFTWDLRNRMASATSNGVTTLYGYDHNGVRVSKQVGTGPTRTFVNDASNPTGYAKPIEERVNGDVDTSYVLGLGVIGQINAANGYLSLAQDGRGYTRGVMNLGGIDLQSVDYDAYGNTLQAGLVPKTPWQAPDGYLDVETGQHYQVARYSDRTTGTWRSQDPITNFGAGGWQDANLHLYVSGDPINLIDPSGEVGLSQLMAVASIISLVAIPAGLSLSMASQGPAPMTTKPQLPNSIAETDAHVHWIRIRGSKMTLDQVFARVASLQDLPADTITANTSPSAAGQMITFSIQHKLFQLGQRPFNVRMTRFDTTNRIMVAETLDGHPFKGWRAWKVSRVDADILVETWSVDRPANTQEFAKFYPLGEWGQDDAWNGFMENVGKWSGGEIVDSRIDPGGFYENAYPWFAKMGIGKFK